MIRGNAKNMGNKVVPAVAINGDVYSIDSLTKEGNLNPELYRSVTSFIPYELIPTSECMKNPDG